MHRNAVAAKPILSLDGADAENRYLLEPSHELTPEKIFDRRWATTLLDQAMSQLRRECLESGKGELFAKVESSLSGQKGDASYAEIAVGSEQERRSDQSDRVPVAATVRRVGPRRNRSNSCHAGRGR